LIVDSFRSEFVRIVTTVALALFIMGVALADSRYKKVWHDEIFTDLIAQSETISDLWRALARGVDLNPPLHHLAVRCANTVLGPSSIALRLHASLGFLLMSVCLYRFVSRRYPAPFAWLAMLVPLATEAFYLASEGRPYGLLLGFSALALVCWQGATEQAGGGRRIWLVGLTLSLAAAVSTHYYGTLAVVPLAIGEAVRTARRRRIDVPIWAAFVLGPLALVGSIPLMIGARKFASTFWAQPSLKSVPKAYSYLLEKSSPPMVALLFVAAIAGWWYWRRGEEREEVESREGDFAPHELAAVASFAAMPFLAVALAIVGKIGFTERYAVTSVIGLAVFVAIAARRVVNGWTCPALAMGGLLIGWTLVMHADPIKSALKRTAVPPPPVGRALLDADQSGLPVVAPHPFLFLEASVGLPKSLAARLVFISEGDDTPTLASRSLKPSSPPIRVFWSSSTTTATSAGNSWRA
jgi:hypothetical protein